MKMLSLERAAMGYYAGSNGKLPPPLLFPWKQRLPKTLSTRP